MKNRHLIQERQYRREGWKLLKLAFGLPLLAWALFKIILVITGG